MFVDDVSPPLVPQIPYLNKVASVVSGRVHVKMRSRCEGICIMIRTRAISARWGVDVSRLNARQIVRVGREGMPVDNFNRMPGDVATWSTKMRALAPTAGVHQVIVYSVTL